MALDLRPETLSRKIVQAHADAIPVVAVIGAREAADGSVVLRDQQGRQRILSIAAAIAALQQEVAAPTPMVPGPVETLNQPIADASDEVAAKIAVGGHDDIWC